MAGDAPSTQKMSRTELSRQITRIVDNDVALVAGIGNAGFDLFHAGHRPANFYMLGSMGLAVPIGLGLALAQPDRPVIVMEGEGSVLMNLGALATVGREQPPNLSIIIWDNEQWQITGGQPLATARFTDLVTVARGCGIESVSSPTDTSMFDTSVRYAIDAPGPHVIVVKIDGSPAIATHHDDPIHVKYEFMQAIGIQPD